ncbi:hypothetical protein ERO13_D10G096200v2 [Gossypium hirsutum]|uniref:Cyclin-dependent kinase inhibitor n=1 Tax=Gossypium hirsutum TaxID=3635 RepID=A0ABM3AW41_GOSHI|nr:cyclin-dependent kinase inhibitor 7-like [Gossypium hirsutum]KAG4125441.1 hypothetical protein ERO13_D10G096200v2 [Gossypium hirsutum]
MRRKCRTVEGIAVMELDNVGVRTIAMAEEAATEAVRNKRRRFNDDDEGGAAECKVTSSTTSYIQLRSRRILVDHHPRNENQCLSLGRTMMMTCHVVQALSARAEKGLSNCQIRRMRALKLNHPRISATETANSSRRETTPLSELRAEPEDMDPTSRPSGGNSRRRSMVEKMPTEAELEEFFVVAEEKLRNQFAEKYNYDILKDQPLEGRYEWARLKP